MSNTSIMSVGELIDVAFGDSDVNTVNFKLIQTVLLLIARQLSVLERYVAVKIGYPIVAPSGSRLSIREVKLHAVVPKKDKHGTKSYAENESIRPDEKPTKFKGRKREEDTTALRKYDESFENSSKDEEYRVKSGEEKIYRKNSDRHKGKVKLRQDEDYADERRSVSSRRKSSANKTSTPGMRTDKAVTSDSKKKRHTLLLEKMEEERERVLRVIHQRADSHEENIRTPTPMASVSSTNLQQEKLLIVEKTSPDKSGKVADGEKLRGGHHVEEERKLSVVTQDQLQKLVQVVEDLKEKFGPHELPFLEDIRKGIPMTDALAGLQLASRIEITEKVLGRMINFVTDIADKTPGVNVKNFTDLKEQYGETITKLRQAESQYEVRTGPTSELRVKIGKNTSIAPNIEDAESKMKTSAKAYSSPTISSTPKSGATVGVSDNPSAENTSVWDVSKKNYVTSEQLEKAIKVVYNDYTTILTNLASLTTEKVDSALKMCTKMEADLAKSLAVEKKMDKLEDKIQSYVERINILDTGLSTQMTNYQEQLTQMQHDLETGLDNMAEALAARTGDNEAMGELNQHFTVLQADFDSTRVLQKDLADIQEAFAIDLMTLKKEIEMLRDVKSDRDEVADALQDKAGLSALNGLVSQVQFDAVRGDLEKRIRHAYDKFNSQEVVWQKSIDDLIREINDKATVLQIDTLRDEIQSKLNELKVKIDFMEDILGTPKAAAIKKQLFRDTECLSCSTPAKMTLEGNVAPEPTWREPGLSHRKAAAESVGVGKLVGDGDHHVPCIPGMPPPHPIDPRAEFCTRYCGGRHTVYSHSYNRAVTTQLPNINISQLTKETRTATGYDGKVYKVDSEINKKPCHLCNEQKTPKTYDKIPEREKPKHQSSSSSMGTPSDLRVYNDRLRQSCPKGTDTPTDGVQ